MTSLALLLFSVLPQPQHLATAAGVVDITETRLIVSDDPKSRLAAQILRDEASQIGAPFKSQRASATLELIDFSTSSDGSVGAALTTKDREILTRHAEQGYVIRVYPATRRVLLVGGSGQGVLYAAATLVQLWRYEGGRLTVPAVHVRDYPDFGYRAAADWLLLGEINRWAYDWGDGRAAYVARVRRKLDFALRNKINMIFFDGFGWSPERIPGYARMMREINRYARDRGIKLIFGGYGSYYDPAFVRPEHNIGNVHFNRHYYPDGEVYACIPGDPMPGGKRESDLRNRGTCRSNEELLRIKAAELEEFVRSVEPGALYIHFEDHGDFDPTQQGWLFRCQYCRRRWPSDDLKSPQGGAGALAHTYRTLYEAVARVRNTDSGYDAARDCTVTMISPVYRLREESQQDWNNVLDLWENLNRLLPRSSNLQPGFREIFPQHQSGQRWMEAYQQRMQSKNLPSNAFIFLLGGSQGYQNRLPFTATAVLSRQFLGAETIYYFSGSVHQEPLQMLNAAFAWNTRSAGYESPVEPARIKSFHRDFIAGNVSPPEIYAPSAFLDLACRKLYGDAAAPFMRQYMTYTEARPKTSSTATFPPHFTDRLAPLVVMFDALQQDMKHWREPGEPNRSLVELWSAQARVNEKAESFVEAALQAGVVGRDARDDVEYLRKCLLIGRRFAILLSHYHAFLESPTAAEGAKITAELRELEDWLYKSFRFETVCPLGGDQASWLDALRALRSSLLTAAPRP